MEQNTIFNFLPETFFVPLSSKNKFIYTEVIFIIYKLVQNGLSYGIDKEIIISEVEEILQGYDEEVDFEDIEEGVNSYRDKANLIVRKLIDYGWVYKEVTSNYKDIINFNDYAITIIESLHRIMKKETLEYQGNIISIYHLLYSEEDINSGIILRQAFDNTKEILGGLKTLNANIKKYMESLTKHKTPEEIMKALFGDYTKDIIDKSYHRLKTSENISKYRPRILSKLEELSYDSNFIKEASEFYMENDQFQSLEDAEDKVREVVYDIITAFNNLDDIIQEIDDKNKKYQRAAFTRAKFLLNNSKDLIGQVKSILEYSSSQYRVLELKLSEDTLDELNDLFILYSHGYIDDTSLYKANEGKKSFKPQAVKSQKISQKERESKLKVFTESQKKKYTINKINNIVQNVLSDRKCILASDIQGEDDDFIKIIFIRLYANSHIAKYKVVPTNEIVDKNGYKYRNFQIWGK